MANWQTDIRNYIFSNIDQNSSLPKESRDELKRLVDRHIQLISQMIATYELLYLREKQEK